MIEIKTIVLGDIETNTYLIKDKSTGALAVIDPACESESLVETIKEWGGDLKFILLTHGHFDHIGGVAFVKNHFDAQVCVSENEVEFIRNPALNGAAWHNLSIDSFDIEKKLSDKEGFLLGDTKIKFLATPGHTAGSGCYIVDDVIFAGDTLFYESIGRTDFPTSNGKDMMLSLMRLSDLEGDFTVYPGHYIKTMLSHERKYNPYMR